MVCVAIVLLTVGSGRVQVVSAADSGTGSGVLETVLDSVEGSVVSVRAREFSLSFR